MLLSKTRTQVKTTRGSTQKRRIIPPPRTIWLIMLVIGVCLIVFVELSEGYRHSHNRHNSHYRKHSRHGYNNNKWKKKLVGGEQVLPTKFITKSNKHLSSSEQQPEPSNPTHLNSLNRRAPIPKLPLPPDVNIGTDINIDQLTNPYNSIPSSGGGGTNGQNSQNVPNLYPTITAFSSAPGAGLNPPSQSPINVPASRTAQPSNSAATPDNASTNNNGNQSTPTATATAAPTGDSVSVPATTATGSPVNTPAATATNNDSVSAPNDSVSAPTTTATGSPANTPAATATNNDSVSAPSDSVSAPTTTATGSPVNTPAATATNNDSVSTPSDSVSAPTTTATDSPVNTPAATATNNDSVSAPSDSVSAPTTTATGSPVNAPATTATTPNSDSATGTIASQTGTVDATTGSPTPTLIPAESTVAASSTPASATSSSNDNNSNSASPTATASGSSNTASPTTSVNAAETNTSASSPTSSVPGSSNTASPTTSPSAVETNTSASSPTSSASGSSNTASPTENTNTVETNTSASPSQTTSATTSVASAINTSTATTSLATAPLVSASPTSDNASSATGSSNTRGSSDTTTTTTTSTTSRSTVTIPTVITSGGSTLPVMSAYSIDVPSSISLPPTRTANPIAINTETTLPMVIVPPGAGVAPPGTVIVQIKLNSLIWADVVNSSTLAAQIAVFLPKDIANALSLDPAQIVIINLINVNGNVVVQIAIPSGSVTALNNVLKNPTSSFYTDGTPISKLVDSTYPIIPQNGPPVSSPDNPNASSGLSNNIGSGPGGSQAAEKNPSNKGMVIGLAVGGSTVLYACVTALVIRAYKRSKTRVVERQNDFLYGQAISSPVMQENSMWYR
ncbi:1426_t:CDS:2 [Ambispora gerdemannii]|uniref:1426_t:CDS:1 n=1 Tax=Ambispora gerdemannii TaxID=144530 RepID=A0A9N9G303_9GLOM|nr:1426_t:CDS:2 [Ambispora gerdemannii]